MRKSNEYYYNKYVEAMNKMAKAEGRSEGWDECASKTRKKLDNVIEKVGLSPELSTKLREAICFAD